jgi:diguanylate cyclase (GGDEF)-like protein
LDKSIRSEHQNRINGNINKLENHVMKLFKRKNANNIIRVLLIFITILYSIIYLFVFRYFIETKERILNSYVSKVIKNYDTINDYNERIADMVYYQTLENNEVMSILYSASKTNDNAILKEERDKLMSIYGDYYIYLQKYDIRQFHFHLEDNTSFLRFHKPDKFGDDLTDIRASVEYVNRTQKPISGFEEGRIFNGYRYVYPVFSSDNYLGSVEVSFSMNSVIKQLKAFYNQEAMFIINKSIVKEKVFDSEIDLNYRECLLSDDYYIDNETYTDCFDNLEERDSQILRKSLRELDLNSGLNSIALPVHNEEIIIIYPILNVSRQKVGYIISATKDEKYSEIKKSFLYITIAFLVLLLTNAFFVYYSHLTRRKIEGLAFYDQLTQILTRRIVLEKLEYEIERFKRYNFPFSLAMIDIDHFKLINDTYGHPAGDQALIDVVKLISTNIRSTDIFGRYGGEEFLLILPNTELQEALSIMNKIRIFVSNCTFKSCGKISISSGLVQMNSELGQLERLIDIVDQRLYKAKNEGRNRVVAD